MDDTEILPRLIFQIIFILIITVLVDYGSLLFVRRFLILARVYPISQVFCHLHLDL